MMICYDPENVTATQPHDPTPKPFLIGMAALGPNYCGNSEISALYTNVLENMDFIKQIEKENTRSNWHLGWYDMYLNKDLLASAISVSWFCLCYCWLIQCLVKTIIVNPLYPFKLKISRMSSRIDVPGLSSRMNTSLLLPGASTDESTTRHWHF